MYTFVDLIRVAEKYGKMLNMEHLWLVLWLWQLGKDLFKVIPIQYGLAIIIAFVCDIYGQKGVAWIVLAYNIHEKLINSGPGLAPEKPNVAPSLTCQILYIS